MRWFLWVFTIILFFVGVGVAQQPSMQSLPEQFANCQSLLRVKQDLPCRCDQAEVIAASLLRRAEKAEEELSQLKAQAVHQAKPPESEKEKEP